MIVIDGENAILGRIASFAAKNALKGEEIAVINCNKIIISGNMKQTKENILKKIKRKGSSQKAPIYPKQSFKIVKRAIRGMLPNPRTGRGREAIKKIKCYDLVPKELEKTERIKIYVDKKTKYSELKKVLEGI